MDTQSQNPVTRQVVYVASPVGCYQTDRYDVMVAHVRRHFPGAEILSARDLYTNSEHWRATWPIHLERITALIYFPDKDSSIGRGVHTEIVDAEAKSILTFFLDDDGSLLPHKRVHLTLINGGFSWRRYALVDASRARAAQTRAIHQARRQVQPSTDQVPAEGEVQPRLWDSPAAEGAWTRWEAQDTDQVSTEDTKKTARKRTPRKPGKLGGAA